MEFGEKTDDSEFLNNLGYTDSADHLEIPCICQNTNTPPYNEYEGLCFRHKGGVTGSPYPFPTITFHPKNTISSGGINVNCFFPGIKTSKIGSSTLRVKSVDMRKIIYFPDTPDTSYEISPAGITGAYRDITV